MTAEDEVRAVSVALDASLIGEFFADGWIHVGRDGVTPKDDLIGWIASGRLAHHRMEAVGTARVMSAGDAVLVTARKASSGTWDGVPYSADERISDVYVRSEGNWRCLLSQKTPANG